MKLDANKEDLIEDMSTIGKVQMVDDQVYLSFNKERIQEPGPTQFKITPKVPKRNLHIFSYSKKTDHAPKLQSIISLEANAIPTTRDIKMKDKFTGEDKRAVKRVVSEDDNGMTQMVTHETLNFQGRGPQKNVAMEEGLLKQELFKLFAL